MYGILGNTSRRDEPAEHFEGFEQLFLLAITCTVWAIPSFPLKSFFFYCTVFPRDTRIMRSGDICVTRIFAYVEYHSN